MIPKVSVIVPIYKAEKYIERCVMSLLKQTLEEIELIFVDDCTPDRSIDILKRTIEQYPNKLNHIKLVHHNTNLGVSISRQDGVNAAIGDYIIHCDPDDWVESDMYDKMYSHAIRTHADIVMSDYVMEYGNKSIFKSLKISNIDSEDLLNALVRGDLHGGLWNKLVNRNFIIKNNIFFTPGLNICEDLIYCIRLMQKHPTVSYLNMPFYHYDKYSNPNAMTQLSTTHDRIQFYNWLNAFDETIKNKNSNVYKTGYTYIAYWAFTHNIFSNKEYSDIFAKDIKLLLFNDRRILMRLVTILSSLGLKNIIFKLYKHIKDI